MRRTGFLVLLVSAVSVGGACHIPGATGRHELLCRGAATGTRAGDGRPWTTALRLPQRIDVTRTEQLIMSGDYRGVCTGRDHACAVSGHGRVRCWGEDLGGQLGTADRSVSPRIVDVEIEREIVAIACGTSHTCAIDAGGEVWCWGPRVVRGQREARPPHLVAGIVSGREIAASGEYTCVLQGDAVVVCFGRDEHVTVLSRRANTLEHDLSQVCATTRDGIRRCIGTRPAARERGTGTGHGLGVMCEVVRERGVVCRGTGPDYLFGESMASATPRTLSGGRSVVDVAAANHAVCVVHQPGSAVCYDPFGRELDFVSMRDSTFRAIYAAGARSCALDDGGRLVCWAIGYSHRTLHLGGIDVDGNAPPCESVYPTHRFTVCASPDGAIAARADNSGGWAHVGRGTVVGTHYYRDLVYVRRDDGVVAISLGTRVESEVGVSFRADAEVMARDFLVCSLTDAHLTCWDLSERVCEPLISEPCSDCRALAIGARHACVVDRSERVSCAGRNVEYQATSPTAVDGAVTDLALGALFTCVQAAGDLSCWGGG